MATQIELLLEKLQFVHDRAIVLDTPRSFFLTLYEYMDVFDKDERLEPISKTISSIKEKEFIKSKELEGKALIEMRSVYKQIRKYLLKTGVSTPEIKDSIEQFEAYERNDGSINSSSGPLEGRYGCLIYILISLINHPDEKHKMFARMLGERDTEGVVIYWSFSPSYSEWEKEQKYIERMQYTKVWFDWDQLIYFYILFRDYEKWRQQQIDEKRIFNVWGLDDMFKELQDIMSYKNDPKRYLRTFDVPAYKTHLQRVHSYTREILLTAEQAVISTSEDNWTFDPVSGVLNLNGKFVPFKKNNFRAKLLMFISKDEKSKKKTWSWDEVYQEIESVDDVGKKEQRQVYEASKGISEYIAKKIGINDFLIYDTKTVRINPNYN